jgi:Fe(3+) dicitrate transport protein
MIRNCRLGASLAVLALLSVGSAAAEDADGDEIVVVGQRVNLMHIPGSGSTIDQEDMESARVLTVNEALRQTPGVFPRDEEGLGLRPNIGVRGLSPTRSSKTLLLEDGLPLTYGPYGDNATYSHPPIRRFARIEVLKGASQIRFGPNTVGGVVNYVTPDAPARFEAELMAAGGNLGYGEIDAQIGGPLLGWRALGHLNATVFDGVRDNHALSFNDLYLKAEREFAPGHDVTLRLGRASEDSQVSYSGLTVAEYAADPFANPFPNDRFELQRYTGSLTHGWRLNDQIALTTSAYSLYFNRDWWRQSSNSAQRPNDAADPACAGMANLNTACGTEGRLREYHVYGVESRLTWDSMLAGAPFDVEASLRWHAERQNRLQVNAPTPTGRTGDVVENNLRSVEAWSGFVTADWRFARFSVQPGVRFEAIAYQRLNRLTGARGQTDLTEIVPGVGATFDLSDTVVLYGGVHRGFAPPRAEDVVSNTGGLVDLDAETSVNWELGARGDLAQGLAFDITAFLMDFDNQIIPASVSGNVGVTNAGATRHAGGEASLRGSLRDMGLMQGDDVFFRTAITYLPDASFEGVRFSSVNGAPIGGNRLPYAPEWVASAAIGYRRGDWFETQLEAQHTSEMYSDDLNSIAESADGQRGLIEAATILNWAANVTPAGGPATYFLTVKNIFDEISIVDRTRGILPSAPRLVQAGVSLAF